MGLIDKQEVRFIESDADAYPQEWNDDYEKGFCDAIHKVLELPTVDDNDLYDKMQDEIKDLRRLLRLAVDDLGKIAAIDDCIFPYCDKRCPFYSYTDCCENKQWQHHDEAWCILNDGSESDA